MVRRSLIRQHVVPDSAGAKIALKANTEYKISVQTGGDAKLLCVLLLISTAFLSEAGNAVDYYLLYGPQLNEVVREYRDLNRRRPATTALGVWLLAMQREILKSTTNPGYCCRISQAQDPGRRYRPDWRYWGKYGWNAMRFGRARLSQSATDGNPATSGTNPSGRLGLAQIRILRQLSIKL